jgi:PLP dependent protein
LQATLSKQWSLQPTNAHCMTPTGCHCAQQSVKRSPFEGDLAGFCNDIVLSIGLFTMSDIATRLQDIRDRMRVAAEAAHRDATLVRLVAVSKTFPSEAVLSALEAGQHAFGENRVEEALPKQDAVRAAAAQPTDWHLIGHLQSRKARDAARRFALIHSVDSVKLASKIHAAAPEQPQAILLQCNVSGEASKEGFDLSRWRSAPAQFDAFAREVEAVFALPSIRIRGLMTMAPIVDDAANARPVFAALRELRDALRARFPDSDAHRWDELSMGMSDDFEAAIAEGATLIRIGRAIFGGR